MSISDWGLEVSSCLDCNSTKSLIYKTEFGIYSVLIGIFSSFIGSSISGDVKKLLVHKTGLEPEDQRLFFRGKEKGNEEHLHMEGVKDKSKILLLENQASQERKLEEVRKNNEIVKASEAVAGVRAEVDKLSERVSQYFLCNFLL